MKEQETIERIKAAIKITPVHNGLVYPNRAAETAWNEMKVIARENPAGPIPAWRNDMTIEQAAQELLRGLKPSPTIPNDSGTGWL